MSCDGLLSKFTLLIWEELILIGSFSAQKCLALFAISSFLYFPTICLHLSQGFFFFFFFLIYIYLFACTGSQLWHAGPSIFVATCRILLIPACGICSYGMWTPSCGRWDLVPWPAIKPGPLLWELSLSHWTTREVRNLMPFLCPCMDHCAGHA